MTFFEIHLSDFAIFECHLLKNAKDFLQNRKIKDKFLKVNHFDQCVKRP